MKKKIQIWVMAATLIICTVTMVFTSCTDNADNAVAEPEQPLSDKEMLMTLYGENKKITDGNYDKSLAVKCINGTFVGKRSGGIVAYKGIPFVGQQPVGELRWKAPDGKAKEWPLYDLENKQLMIFDEFNIHPEKESQRKILDWDRTYFLTKYYCL